MGSRERREIPQLSSGAANAFSTYSRPQNASRSSNSRVN